ncbi:MAG: invasion associated locus B family protein [Pseudomonadota bacterium]
MKTGLFIAGALTSALATVAVTLPAYSQAQAPTRIKQHNAWGAYSHTGSAGKVCYALSVPTQKEPADRDHGDVFFMVAKHPGQNVNFEPQFTVGYPFADNSKVILDIDGKKFSMFTKGSNAWMENPAEEPTVVAAMRAGSKMSVSGQSRRGTETKYAYSLSGVTASLKEIETCQ